MKYKVIWNSIYYYFFNQICFWIHWPKKLKHILQYQELTLSIQLLWQPQIIPSLMKNFYLKLMKRITQFYSK